MKRYALYTIGLVAIGLAGNQGYNLWVKPQPVPAVSFATINGEQFTSADLRGKVVLINFWATSCVICVQEMPEITTTYERFKSRGFETIAVAMSYDPPNYVVRYAEKNRLPFKVALDIQGRLAREFGNVQLTPTTFVVDKRGTIVARYIGAPNFADLHKLLEEKLSEKSAEATPT